MQLFQSGVGRTCCCAFVLQLNALANRAAGKGYENEDNYSNIRFQFVGIENIHVMRTSLQKLLEGYRCFAKNTPPALKSVYKNNQK